MEISGKTVKKLGNNSWIIAVEKLVGVKKVIHFSRCKLVNSQVFQKKINWFCTNFSNSSSLLYLSFTHFPHRSTITIYLNNGD